jgi:hypothetical protein
MELQEIIMEIKIEADIHMLYRNQFIFRQSREGIQQPATGITPIQKGSLRWAEKRRLRRWRGDAAVDGGNLAPLDRREL